jgi:hypothetical protein
MPFSFFLNRESMSLYFIPSPISNFFLPNTFPYNFALLFLAVTPIIIDCVSETVQLRNF